MADPPDATEILLAEGQAALVLVESVLLALVEANVIDKQHIIEALEGAIATKRTMLAEGKAPAISAAAVGLLTSIANSMTAAGGQSAQPASSRAESKPAKTGRSRRG
jgi:hypothetical protein